MRYSVSFYGSAGFPWDVAVVYRDATGEYRTKREAIARAKDCVSLYGTIVIAKAFIDPRTEA